MYEFVRKTSVYSRQCNDNGLWCFLNSAPMSPGGGELDLNLKGVVPLKNSFYPAPEFLPLNDT